MARFYGTLKGAKGERTACGTPSSGMTAVAKGWNLGGKVVISAHGDQDRVTVYITSGSNALRPDRIIYEGTLYENELEKGNAYRTATKGS